MAIAGVDIGTTGCKCSVYDNDGQFIAESYEPYNSIITEDKHEINPELVADSVKKVIQAAAGGIKDITAIGITSFGESAVMLDENDQVITNAVLYTDPRGRKQCDHLIESLGTAYLNDITGLSPDINYSLVKWMWLKENQPDIYKKCKRILLMTDYLVYTLSGVAQIDYSLAARTMAFDVNKRTWDSEILKVAGIDETLLPQPIPIGSKAGVIKSSLAKTLGLSPETSIVTGCHDQIAAAVGTGVYKKGMAVDGTGTVECITNVFDSEEAQVKKEGLYQGGFAVVPFLDNLSVAYAFSFTGGALLRWYKDNIASLEAETAVAKGLNPYEEFNKKMDMTKPSGLLVLPYFAGAGTPYLDADVRGAVLGMTMHTTSNDIYKGLMEGVTYEMRLNIELLEASGISINEIRATGGGATSKEWLQIKADILKKPVVTLGAAQSGTLGCVMLAGVACGIYEDLQEAEQIMIKRGETFYPNNNLSGAYDVLYERYKKLYPSIKEIGL